ncbi:GAF domain-containing protein [Pseudoduganella sp. UC29_106]|uniref:GAF domain-containing protein n=1 Tax=Pseudoduganella sp. UC29_106 TaxID=3374553 RepID=UPI00375685DE
MIPAPTPENEAGRIAALYLLLLLDTPREERFDRIVEFAAREFDVPIALISLIDSERQWFKAAVGLGDVCETGRDISFCGHAIMRSDIMVVPDALADTRFSDNPLVSGAPHIRFYAGAPLILRNGYALGTLCLIDTRPRRLDDVEMAIFSTLRGLLMQELEGEHA